MANNRTVVLYRDDESTYIPTRIYDEFFPELKTLKKQILYHDLIGHAVRPPHQPIPFETLRRDYKGKISPKRLQLLLQELVKDDYVIESPDPDDPKRFCYSANAVVVKHDGIIEDPNMLKGDQQ